ncbi:hypothetical protein L1049_003269 [Liquidambar formosana]|uniref:Plastid lipid-associated protein/fibrillin conserved domain-containing protein n=1 Tax=Liquidambar formosana TaxID=63359 RepID=A0AAP0NHB4_LIQFO
MAAKLVQPPIPTSHVVPLITRTSKTMRSYRRVLATHPWTKSTRFGECPSGFRPFSTIKVAEQSSGILGDDKEIEEQNEEPSDYSTVSQIKTDLYHALQGINRGIFGVPSAKKSEIENLVKLLESQNPTPNPTTNLDKLGGCWKLVYSTITILGSKRTKLGLRDFITLGDFLQTIDVAQGKAVNVIKFNVRGLNLLNGQLTIEASFKTASKSVKAPTLFPLSLLLFLYFFILFIKRMKNSFINVFCFIFCTES